MDLEEILQDFKTKRISANRLAIYTSNNRIETIQTLQRQISNSIYINHPISLSSIGCIKKDGDFLIVVKPLLNANPGQENEHVLYNMIKFHTNPNPINITFQSKDKSWNVDNVMHANLTISSIGRKKSDLTLTNMHGDTFHISLKKDDAEIWESADTYFAKEAKKLIHLSPTLLHDNGSHFRINPNLATPANQNEKHDVVFGSDIKSEDAVIIRSLRMTDFIRIQNRLYVTVSDIIKTVQEAPDIYFLIRNDKARNGIEGYPGLRVIACSKSRITNNVQIIQRAA